MAVKYAYFERMLNHYFKMDGRGLSKKFLKEFSKLIRMAGYLDDVNPEAHKIVEEYEVLRACGAVMI